MPAPASKKPSRVFTHLSQFFTSFGLFLFALGLGILFYTFYPTIALELKYFFQPPLSSDSAKLIRPVDTSFGLIIPKLGANARVIPEVDPFNPKIYQAQLTKGVAHAQGSSYPGRPGNVFIFSHSSDNFYQANRYNSVFFLLHRLEPGDEIYLIYQQVKYKYVVDELKIVAADQINYLTQSPPDSTLTLMTCWPPGTTLKRLLVLASSS